MSLKRTSEIQIEDLYNVRIKCIDTDGEILDLKTEESIFTKLKSISICITPYQIKNNVMTYYDYSDNEQRVVVPMSDDIENIIPPLYRSDDYKFVQDYKEIDEFFKEFKFNLSQQTFQNSVDLELYIDFASDNNYYFDQYFMEFLFKYFTGNIILYGNENTIWELPNGEITIESLTIERGILRLNSINNFRLQSFNLTHLSIMGKNVNFQAPDQIVFYSKDSSNISYCSIDNCVQIGISGEVETQYKWLNSSLSIYSLDINFNTDADKVGKFEHIVKIDNYAEVNIVNVNINQRLTKLVPFKLERCPTVSISNYANTLRPKDKGTVEFNINNTTDLTMNNITVIAEDINEKETSVVALTSIENGDNLIFNNIYITNMNFLNISNVNSLNLDINNLTIDTNQAVINIGSDVFIDSFNINNANIVSYGFSLKDLKSVYIADSYIKSKGNINFSITDLVFDNTELIAMKNITLTSSGYIVSEEIEGRISLLDSIVTATADLNITTDRDEGRLTIDNTLIKAKNYSDSGFEYVNFKNNSEFIIYTLLGESNDYMLKEVVFNNKYINKFEKAYQFKGLVDGSFIIKFEDNNQKFSLYLYQPSMDSLNQKDLEITFNDNMNGKTLDCRIDIENICQSIIYKNITGTSSVSVNLYIQDDSEERLFYTCGLKHYKTSDSKNLNLYLKNTSVEDMQNVLNNDGSIEESSEKLNFGTEPS